MELVDTHCHLQFDNYADPSQVVDDARAAGVTRLICVGTSLADSQKAIRLAHDHDNMWTSAGIHPHEATKVLQEDPLGTLLKDLLKNPEIVAIGEIGLDFYKNYSPIEDQKKALKLQIETGLDSGLPFIFHVRDSWKDFWQIFDSYKSAGGPMRGVIHSFSTDSEQLELALKRGLYVGLNGIMTFTSDQKQLEAAKNVPINRLVLETDAPFLAPKPFRGKTCEPKHIVQIAEFLANLRDERLEDLASSSTKNAIELFNLK